MLSATFVQVFKHFIGKKKKKKKTQFKDKSTWLWEQTELAMESKHLEFEINFDFRLFKLNGFKS